VEEDCALAEHLTADRRGEGVVSGKMTNENEKVE